MPELDVFLKLTTKFQALGGRIWRTIPGKLWKGFFKGITKAVHKKKTVNAAILALPSVNELFPAGEPDCHFYTQQKITQDMVGEKVLLFGKLEIKTQAYKKLTKDQIRNLMVIHKKGGLALVVTEQKDGSLLEETIIEYQRRVRK